MIKPYPNIVFVTPPPKPKPKKVGAIILPASEDKRLEDTHGIVAFAGPGCECGKGDLVLYNTYDFHEIEVDGVKYQVGPNDKILAILK